MLASLPPSLEKLDVILQPPIKVAKRGHIPAHRPCACIGVAKSWASNAVDGMDCSTSVVHRPWKS